MTHLNAGLVARSPLSATGASYAGEQCAGAAGNLTRGRVRHFPSLDRRRDKSPRPRRSPRFRGLGARGKRQVRPSWLTPLLLGWGRSRRIQITNNMYASSRLNHAGINVYLVSEVRPWFTYCFVI